jgi:hypothetical protein
VGGGGGSGLVRGAPRGGGGVGLGASTTRVQRRRAAVDAARPHNLETVEGVGL